MLAADGARAGRAPSTKRALLLAALVTLAALPQPVESQQRLRRLPGYRADLPLPRRGQAETRGSCDLQRAAFKRLPRSRVGDGCCSALVARGRTSQSQEDKAVHNRYFCGRTHGTFVEMGALDGLTYSNTKLFEESPLDWRGLLVEANPSNAQAIPRNRPLAKLAAEAACPEVTRLHFCLRCRRPNYTTLRGTPNSTGSC